MDDLNEYLPYCLRCKYGGPRRKNGNMWTICDAVHLDLRCFDLPPSSFIPMDNDMILENEREVWRYGDSATDKRERKHN